MTSKNVLYLNYEIRATVFFEDIDDEFPPTFHHWL